MVSHKVIFILLIIAVLLSVISIIITLSFNIDKIPVIRGKTTDSSTGKINLIIEKSSPSGTVGEVK